MTKRIFDSVHGFIRLDPLTVLAVDSYPFQRLRYIRQLGCAHLLFPGGVHTRFEHSLGVMEVATRIFDQVTATFSSLTENIDYWRQVTRLAALCHDFGHLPFSHVSEHLFSKKGGHEYWTAEIIKSKHFGHVIKKVKELWPDFSVEEDIIKIALGQEKCNLFGLLLTPWQKVCSEMITGDFFGADRIDYLLRDAHCTGVCYGLFDYEQLIEMVRVFPFEGELRLGIEEGGMNSCEALLIARHFMHRRVYAAPTVKALSFHLSEFMRIRYKDKKIFETIEGILSMTDNEVLVDLNTARKDPSDSAHIHARALFERAERFSAVFEECFESKEPNALNFPVLLKDQLVLASTLSSIEIKSSKKKWSYFPPIKEREKTLS